MALHTTATVAISGGPTLSAVTTGNYVLVADSLGDVAQTPRNAAVTSPWVHGAYLVSSVLEQTEFSCAVDIKGSSVANLISNIAALRTALQQFSYTVTVTVGGTAEVWTAMPGSVNRAGGMWQDDRLKHLYQRVVLSIPVFPISA